MAGSSSDKMIQRDEVSKFAALGIKKNVDLMGRGEKEPNLEDVIVIRPFEGTGVGYVRYAAVPIEASESEGIYVGSGMYVSGADLADAVKAAVGSDICSPVYRTASIDSDKPRAFPTLVCSTQGKIRESMSPRSDQLTFIRFVRGDAADRAKKIKTKGGDVLGIMVVKREVQGYRNTAGDN